MANNRSMALRVVLWAGMCAACSGPPAFEHDVIGEALPWTHDQADNADDKFTFAVFSDLTGGERPRIFEIAVAQLNLLRPELIINVGDLIEGGTDEPSDLATQWDSFDERAERARAPVFYVGGNHDLTGAVLQGVWDERYGRRYYHVRYRDVLFLVLDTEDNTPERNRQIKAARDEAIDILQNRGRAAFDSSEYATLPERAAGNVSLEQMEYFLRVLAANPDVRHTFFFMHKAPWLRDDAEHFMQLEDALAERPYTVFHGHEHYYGYEERRGRDYVQLATTGGSQIPNRDRSVDHVTLVTVSDEGVDIANLLMDGILDKTGHVPLGGDTVCFEIAACQ